MEYDWYDEMEKAEQEYDAREYELAQEYSRGYEQGKADKDKELSELPNQYSEKLWKNAYNKGYEQGKADAIKECKSIVMQTLDNDLLVDTLLLRMNQLKEQNK